MDSMVVVSEEQLKFVHPFTMMLAGGKRSGKTLFTKALLERNDELVSSPPLDTIVWFYGAWQDDVFDALGDVLRAKGQHVEFVDGLPKDRTVQDIVLEMPGERKLIVMDDLMETASNRSDVAALFTHGRHLNISVMFLSQNFFHQSKYARDMSLNIDYAVLFKNIRSPSMVTNLGQQMGNAKFLKEAFDDATIIAFSHLSIDMRSDTLEAIRYRSNVLREEQIVYQP